MKLVWNDSVNEGVTLRLDLATVKEKVFRGGGWGGGGVGWISDQVLCGNRAVRSRSHVVTLDWQAKVLPPPALCQPRQDC